MKWPLIKSNINLEYIDGYDGLEWSAVFIKKQSICSMVLMKT